MHLSNWLLVATAAIFLQSSEIVSAANGKVVCYFGSWSSYRQGNGKFTIESINPSLCTHIIYSFVGINTDGTIKILDPGIDISNRGYERLNDLKKLNPNVKTLVAIGGWNEGSSKYSIVAADAGLRRNFIKDAVAFLAKHEFDGFDLDWEYPGQRGGAAADKANFATLLKEFREEFDKHGYLLSAAVAAASPSVDLSYDVPSLSKYLDFINVMAYDLHGAYDGATGQNCPLYPSPADVTSYQKELNVDACIKGWLQRGAAPEKLILGIGTYGQTFTLSDANVNGIGAPASGPGNQGPYTLQSGMLGYNEICELHKAGDWTIRWSEEQKVPFAHKGNQWVGYDDPESVTIKVNYAKSLKLGGVMIWSVETDDFRGICGPKYPLLNAINSALHGSGSRPPPTTTKPTTTSKATTTKPKVTTTTAKPKPTVTTKKPSTSNPCKEVGYVRDPEDCNKFYYCVSHNGVLLPVGFNCPGYLCYNPKHNLCDWECEGCD